MASSNMLQSVLILSICVSQTVAFSIPSVGLSYNRAVSSSPKIAGLVPSRMSSPLSSLRMGGGNVPRVPYKAPGEDSYQACFNCFSGSYQNL
jgi:hypothetical protein